MNLDVQRAMSLDKKIKTALDETRLLILGAQILFGFQFQGLFQDGFREVSKASKVLDGVASLLMVIAIGLLIAPSLRHRIVEQGQSTVDLLRVTSLFAGAGMLPLMVSLGLDVFIVFERSFGVLTGILSGVTFCGLAAFFWYGLAFWIGLATGGDRMPQEGQTPLATKVEQMLIEARVIIPGCQALLGFQLIAMLTRGFDELPTAAKLIHAAALCSVALSVILLMTPAALHRLSFGGEDSTQFLRLGSKVVIAATVPLALGIAADIAVAFFKLSASPAVIMTAAVAAMLILGILWYGYPMLLRARGAGK